MKNNSKPLDLSNIKLVYQPQYDVVSNTIIGFEALARLETENGLLTPYHFFEQVKEGNYEALFTQIVFLRFVHDYHAYFINLDTSLHFSINIDPDMVVNGFIVNLLLQLRAHKFNHIITLEITEKKLTTGQHKQLTKNINRLISSGYEISIDDYGSGDSNDFRVFKLKPNEIKVDKSR